MPPTAKLSRTTPTPSPLTPSTRTLGLLTLTVLALAVLTLAAGLTVPLTAQEEEAKKAEEKTPLVVVEEVTVEPADPGPETLCRLTVKLRNGGERPASLFGFGVTVNGQPLTVYDKELFALAVDPGTAADLRLFNFWSAETGRPAPKDGKLTVEVRLKEAQWVEIKTEDGAEVWTPTGAVEGLPVAKSLTLKMKK